MAAASVGTHDPFLFQIVLHDAAELGLAGLDLPESLPALGAFMDRSWMLAFTPIALLGFEQTGARGTLLSATLTPLAVPEPAGFLLLVLGIAAWWRYGPARDRG